MNQRSPSPKDTAAGPDGVPTPESYRDLRGPRRAFIWLIVGTLVFEFAGVLAIWHQVGSLSSLEIAVAIFFGVSNPVLALALVFDAYVNRHPVSAAISNGRLVVTFPPTRLSRRRYEVALADIGLIESWHLKGERPRMAISIHSPKLPLRCATLELSSDALVHVLRSLSPGISWRTYP